MRFKGERDLIQPLHLLRSFDQIEPGGEGITGPGENDAPRIWLIDDRPKQVSEFIEHLDGERVLAIGSIERDRGDVIGRLEQNVAHVLPWVSPESGR